SLIQSLNSAGRGMVGRAGRLNSALVVIEIGLAVVLVIGAGLLLKSLWLLARANPGFSTERLLTVDVTPNKSFGADRAQCLTFYDELLLNLGSLPGVENTAAINSLPLTGDIPVLPVSISDYHPERPDAQAPLVWVGAITPAYCEIMGIPVLQGRSFNNDDRADTAGVVMVTASTARNLWPSQDPIGKHIKPVWDKQWHTVVGVVADVKQYGLAKTRPDW